MSSSSCPCYIHANLVEIGQTDHEIWCTSTFWLKFGSFSPAMTLKIRSRSLKPNQLFTMSQCYIIANLVKIHPPVHEILCKQESYHADANRIHTKNITLPFRGGHNKCQTIQEIWCTQALFGLNLAV